MITIKFCGNHVFHWDEMWAGGSLPLPIIHFSTVQVFKIQLWLKIINNGENLGSNEMLMKALYFKFSQIIE